MNYNKLTREALILAASVSSRTLQSNALHAFNIVVSNAVITPLQYLFKITDQKMKDFNSDYINKEHRICIRQKTSNINEHARPQHVKHAMPCIKQHCAI